MSEQKKPQTLGDKINAANHPITGKELAAAQRDDRVRALEEEKVALQKRDLPERVKSVDAEIKRLKSAPTGRQAAAPDQTA